VCRVAQAFQRSPQHSARHHSIALHLTPRTVRRILHEDLKFHPFKIQMVQRLPHDLNQRSECCRKFLQIIERTPQFLDHLIMSDEAHFHLNGYVNKQNFRYWAAENPDMLHQKPLHSEKVTVWCGVSAFGVLGAYFFENATGQSVMVLSDRYVDPLREFLNDELCRLRVDTRLVWFQQDGATTHTAQNSMAVI